MNRLHVFLYGPPGSGKSTLGAALAKAMNRKFIDIDEEIVRDCGRSIVDIFNLEGEDGFRALEHAAIEKQINAHPNVIALGGGALLNQNTREIVEKSGKVLLLNADHRTLCERIEKTSPNRPLLSHPDQSPEWLLSQLLEHRKIHYASFVDQLETADQFVDELVFKAQVKLGIFHLSGMGKDYDVLVLENGLTELGNILKVTGINNRLSIVTDENVANFFMEPVVASLSQEGFDVHPVVIKPGESNKTVHTLNYLWDSFAEARLERGSAILALGGGVVGDLAGFAASTFMRGIQWVPLPTTLLAMIDASIGGKTAADLLGGKNLIGAFHAPSLVLTDPCVLDSLPLEECRSGVAEVVKHGIIADENLFGICQKGWNEINLHRSEVVKRAIAVKVRIIQEDPYEKGKRAVLNFGHTIGHALELASNYHLRHGEAVAIGMVKAAEISVNLGIAEKGLDGVIRDTLVKLGLPVAIPEDLDRKKIIHAIHIDKKRLDGMPKFVLPVSIGKVLWGIELGSFERWFDD
jgi:shikimate kinase / 3-dehydroquinate synthase